MLDRDRQRVEGVLELIDPLGLLLNPATQLLKLRAGLRDARCLLLRGRSGSTNRYCWQQSQPATAGTN